jgi:hypothetical protein
MAKIHLPREKDKGSDQSTVTLWKLQISKENILIRLIKKSTFASARLAMMPVGIKVLKTF